MCGIAGLYTKIGQRCVSSSARSSRRCSSSSRTAAPTAPASRSTAIPAPAGWCKVSLHSPAAAPGLGGAAAPSCRARVRRRLAAVDPRHARGVRDRRRGRRRAGVAGRPPPRADADERRAHDRDLQGGRARRRASSSGSRSMRSPAATRSVTPGWRPRAGSPPSTRTRSRPGSTCVWSTTARCPTTTGCGASLQREGIRFRTDCDSEVAAGYLTWRLREGATLEQALEGCLDGSRRLLHIRGRHGRRLRGAARPDRLQARGDGRDRRMGRDGVRVPGDRGAAGRRGRGDLGACAGPRVQLGHRVPGGVMATPDVIRDAVLSFDLAVDTVRALNQRAAHGRVGPGRSRSSTRAAATRSRSGSTAPYEVEIDGHVGYYCAGMNKRRHRPRARQLRRRAWPRT